jgi:hypothetical protein
MFLSGDAKHSADEKPIKSAENVLSWGYLGVLAEKPTDPQDYLQRLNREVNFSSANQD